jgi:hypothetical protein
MMGNNEKFEFARAIYQGGELTKDATFKESIALN